MWSPFVRASAHLLPHPSLQGARDGAFRASFEDKPLLSDVVFLK